MRKILLGLTIMATPPVVAMLLLWKMVKELERDADEMAYLEEWWDDVFDEYEWDDDWVDGGWSEHYDPT